jgi:hypothetical protein
MATLQPHPVWHNPRLERDLTFGNAALSPLVKSVKT